jgi:hypothetical protein
VVSEDFFEFLLSRDEVRLDEEQTFVRRGDEQSFVASFHFPSRGKARQVKFKIPIVDTIRQMYHSSLNESDEELLSRFKATIKGTIIASPAEEAFVDQALVDFEQLCVNFMTAALPELETSASLLAQLNPRSETLRRDSLPRSERADGLQEYIVNRNTGWPVMRPRFKHLDVVRLDPANAQRDVESGYLVSSNDAEANTAAYGPEYRDALAAHRAFVAAELEATRTRLKPTDIETVLTSGPGRAVRKHIVAALMRVAKEVLFPSSAGRPPKRSAGERERLRKQLIEAHRELRAKLAAKGERTGKLQVLPLLARRFRMKEDEIDKLLWPRKQRDAASPPASGPSNRRRKARRKR